MENNVGVLNYIFTRFVPHFNCFIVYFVCFFFIFLAILWDVEGNICLFSMEHGNDQDDQN